MRGAAAPFAFAPGGAVGLRSQPSQPQPLAALACRRMKPAIWRGKGSFSNAAAMPRRAAAGISAHPA